jgi:hypothetical protein
LSAAIQHFLNGRYLLVSGCRNAALHCAGILKCAELTLSQTLAHQVRLMNNLLKKVLAVLIVAAVAAPAVSFAAATHHHHTTKAKHVKHTAH